VTELLADIAPDPTEPTAAVLAIGAGIVVLIAIVAGVFVLINRRRRGN
jgi:hypothetical protein